jgi:hypothetical protein
MCGATIGQIALRITAWDKVKGSYKEWVEMLQRFMTLSSSFDSGEFLSM